MPKHPSRIINSSIYREMGGLEHGKEKYIGIIAESTLISRDVFILNRPNRQKKKRVSKWVNCATRLYKTGLNRGDRDFFLLPPSSEVKDN